MNDKKIEIEFPLESARLEFAGMSRPLVLNPRKEACEFRFNPDAQGYTCAKCFKSGMHPDHSRESGIPLSRFLDESGDYAAQWFAFWEEDCMAPPIYIVRAESFEQAYEDFVNEVVSRFPLSESDLADYKKDSEGYYEDLIWTDKGWVSTENVNGREISLVSVEVKP